MSCRHAWETSEAAGIDCRCTRCGQGILAADLLAEIADLRKVAEAADGALAAFGDEYEGRLGPLREAIAQWEDGLSSRGRVSYEQTYYCAEHGFFFRGDRSCPICNGSQ
jgi:rubrerythrin